MLTLPFLLIAAIPVVLLAAGLALRLLLPKPTARVIGFAIHIAGVIGALALMIMGFRLIGGTDDVPFGSAGTFNGFLYGATGVGVLIFAMMLSRLLRP